MSYTDQEDVVKNPNVDDTFAGLRLSSTYKHQFGERTTYGNDTILDENLSETKDFRARVLVHRVFFTRPRSNGLFHS